MKKCISIFVLLALVSVGGTFAAELGFGGGLLFDYSANNGVKAEAVGESAYEGLRNTSFGGFFFLDATYVELDLSFAYGSLTYVVEQNMSAPGVSVNATTDFGSVLQLGITLLGKYPISVGSVTIFPLLGISYNSVLSFKDSAGNSYSQAGDLSQFGFLGGIGADFNISDSLYVRAEGLFQLRLASKFQDDMAAAAKASYALRGITGVTVDTTLGMGPVIKLAIGYKL